MSGVDGFGASLSRGDGADPEVFEPIGNLTSITIPGFTRETYDVTAHDSPDKWREVIGGLLEGGECTAEFNYDPTVELDGETVYVTLVEDAENPDPINYEIALPDGSSFECALLITSYDDVDVPFDGPITGSVTFRMSGKPTFTAAA